MTRKTKENIVIFAAAGALLFSSIGAGLLLLTDDSSDPPTSISTNPELNQEEAAVPLDTPDAFIPEGDVTELVKTDLTPGDGAEVKVSDTITVHYHGTLASDGTIFDSSFQRGEPATFPLSGLIPGWQEGIPGMKVGGTRRLVIPSELAYGASGSGAIIGPNADLVFVIEVVDIVTN